VFVPSRDKVVRATPLEPVIAAGNMYVRRAEWTDGFLERLRRFPGTAKDDEIDALSGGYHVATEAVEDFVV